MVFSKKIILVEDNKAEADLAKLVFSELKIDREILHFSDGADFLNHLPDLDLGDICYLLLDLNMPKVNGFHVLKKLAEHQDWKKIPVIVFTSSSHEADVNECYDLGANAFVSKPLDINDLDSTLSAIDFFWGKKNTRPYFH